MNTRFLESLQDRLAKRIRKTDRLCSRRVTSCPTQKRKKERTSREKNDKGGRGKEGEQLQSAENAKIPAVAVAVPEAAAAAIGEGVSAGTALRGPSTHRMRPPRPNSSCLSSNSETSTPLQRRGEETGEREREAVSAHAPPIARRTREKTRLGFCGSPLCKTHRQRGLSSLSSTGGKKREGGASGGRPYWFPAAEAPPSKRNHAAGGAP